MGDEALAIVATSSDASEAGTGNVPPPSTGTARRCRSCLPPVTPGTSRSCRLCSPGSRSLATDGPERGSGL